MALNVKHTRFVTEYVIDLNATQAAIRAGYSEKTAYSQGQRLLKNVEIKKAIDEAVLEIRKNNIADAIEVEEYLTSVLRGEKTEPVLVLDGDGKQKVSMLTPSVKDRTKAAELLGKRHKLFTDKTENTTTMDASINITIDYGDDDET